MTYTDFVEMSEDLLALLELNVYGKPYFIEWTAPQRAQLTSSSFATLLISHFYSWSLDETSPFHKYMGVISPYSADYANYFKGKGSALFMNVNGVSNLQRGDIIAINYFGKVADATGHTMIVRNGPVKISPFNPFIPKTTQYKVEVIDCTNNPHGDDDTRIVKEPNNGIGIGSIRIFADEKDVVVGYTWSLRITSKFIKQKEREMMLGRLNVDELKMSGYIKL